MGTRKPLRHSLLVRLLAVSALVATCSIAATAWLAAQSVSTTIQQEQGQALASDSRTYEALLGYAVAHPKWDGVEQTVRDLAKQAGRRVALTTEDRQPIADSGGTFPLPTRPSTVVDPLAIDLALVPGAPPDRIDPRILGPFLLPPDEQTRLRDTAAIHPRCTAQDPSADPIEFAPNGHPLVKDEKPKPGVIPLGCGDTTRILKSATATEQAALKQLEELVNTCLARQNQPAVALTFDRLWRPALPPDTGPQAASCFTTGRQQQLRPYAAPAALLFITDSAGNTTTTTTGGLSSVGTNRIALVAALVLLLTVGISVIAATLLVRPVRALTTAAQRMRQGDSSARVAVRARGEIGELAAAFNEMAEHRERTEEQRRTMVSDISHELRTPLGTIRSWLEAAKDGVIELDDTRLTSLLEEALVLQHLIDDLQQLALADSGQLRLHREPVDIADLLDQVAAAHRAHAESITLTTAVDRELEVSADPVRLRQVLTNLVANALRYTPTGGTVRLRAHLAGEWVVIEVSDTGVGISQEDLPYVFDRFWRADRSRTRETGGSGLGLAIVHDLVQAHGGTVDVASTLGTGTTFTIRLPR